MLIILLCSKSNGILFPLWHLSQKLTSTNNTTSNLKFYNTTSNLKFYLLSFVPPSASLTPCDIPFVHLCVWVCVYVRVWWMRNTICLWFLRFCAYIFIALAQNCVFTLVMFTLVMFTLVSQILGNRNDCYYYYIQKSTIYVVLHFFIPFDWQQTGPH